MPRIPGSMSDACGHHAAGFADFVAMEGLAGGPSPNVKLIRHAATSDGVGADELAWRACCYASIYNTPSAAALWTAWPLAKIEGLRDPGRLVGWLTENKAGLPVHSNRVRTTGSPRGLAECMLSMRQFVLQVDLETGDDFDRLWSQVTGIKKVGRYFGIKLAGTLRRLGVTSAEQYDIRARGAKNGRRTLGLIFPAVAAVVGDHKNNSRQALAEVDAGARRVMEWLGRRHQLHPTWFELEALLCEYNQCVKGDRYPGKTSDADLGALNKVIAHFGEDGPGVRQVLEARRAVLPAWSVDREKRDDLLDVYSRLGYMWSDAVYDYDGTTDLAEPERTHLCCSWTPLTVPGRKDGS